MNSIPGSYFEVCDYLGARYAEVDGLTFYREIFPRNERSTDRAEDFSTPNAIYLYTAPELTDKQGNRRTMRRRIMFADTWEADYMEFVEGAGGTLCGGLAYRGRVNRLNNAQAANALAIDLDGVGLKEIKNLFLRFGKPAEKLRTLPMPTYIVASGSGIHVYYVFDEPIALFPNIKSQLKGLKHDLTFRMWEYKSTSRNKAIQYQSINQGFRMVGSVNEKYGCTVRAFKVGDSVSIDYLNSYVKSKVDLEQRFRPSRMTKEQARLSFPEWYEKTFDENGKKRKGVVAGKWDIAGKVHGDNPFALYDWWRSRAGEAKGGHRYFYLMCMSIYACKCDVPKKKLRQDMKEIYETLREVEHDNPLTMRDINSALEMYSKEFYNFTIKDIEALTDIRIERNRRNGLKQFQHLAIARDTKKNKKRFGIMKGPDGRPKGFGEKKDIVTAWRMEHPTGKKIDCEKDTGLSRHTVLKWWDA